MPAASPYVARDRAPFARAAYVVAAGAVLVLLALAGRYGPHRDELYFVAAGQHPQWGYPDQPPLTPLVAAAAHWIAPGSLLALRLVPALLVGAVTLLSADLARALGGERTAQLLAALVTATGAGVLAVGHMLSTATLDLFAWTVVVRLTVAVLSRDNPRLWLAIGLVLGIGLQNKHLIAFLGVGLVAGIALTPALRHHLRSPWAWAGALVALALWAPNLAWQATHGWPQFDLAADIRDEYQTPGGTAALVGFQVLLLGPLGFLLAVLGIRAGLRRPDWVAFRPVPIAYLLLIPAFVLLGGKHYYLLALLPPLAAAGAVVVTERWSPSRVRTFAVAVVLTALVPLPALLPVLPAQTYGDSFYPSLAEDGLEMIGWPGVVATVRAVVADLPADQRDRAVVVTSNYGEAGALLWYGETPPVFSGHNGFGDWGPPASTGPVLWLGATSPGEDRLRDCRRAATLRTGVDGEEDGNGVWVCAGPTGGWAHAWPLLRHLDA